MNSLVFEQWLSKFYIGWIPIALFKRKQIFLVTDFREKCRYFYVMSDSRREVMEWIIDFGQNFFVVKNCRQEDTIKWFSCKKSNRGKVYESFEIVRLLDGELPRGPFNVYNTIAKLSFKTFLKKNLPQRKSKIFKIKKIIRFSDSILYGPDISQLKKDWSWNFHEAVFQIGILLEEFERMYLLRCLFRREKLNKKVFFGWKVQLLRDFKDSKDLLNPFWNISVKEEETLEKLLQRIGIFPEKIFQYVNTPAKERKRRFDFQKKCKFFK